MADGSMKPIAYASRSPNPAEKMYSQLDKEGLAIVFGVKKFHHNSLGEHSLSVLITSPFSISSQHHVLFHNWLQPEFNVGL